VQTCSADRNTSRTILAAITIGIDAVCARHISTKLHVRIPYKMVVGYHHQIKLRRRDKSPDTINITMHLPKNAIRPICLPSVMCWSDIGPPKAVLAKVIAQEDISYTDLNRTNENKSFLDINKHILKKLLPVYVKNKNLSTVS